MAKSVSVSSFGTSEARYIYRYTAATSTWSSNLYNTGSIDLFSDSFAVDDCIYFGQADYLQHPILSIQFDIATAMAATSYTLVWEYYSYQDSGTWRELNVKSDGPNSFSTTGTNEIWFHTAEDCYHATIQGTLSKWYRVRVTAVDTPTEGGAINTAIQARQAKVNISGGTSSSPITIDDILADSEVISYELFEEKSNVPLTTSYRRFFISHATISQTDTTGYCSLKSISIYWEFGYFGGYGTYDIGTLDGSYWRYGCLLSMNHNSTIYWGSNDCTTNSYFTRFEARRGQLIGYSVVQNFYGCQVCGPVSLAAVYGGKTLNYTDCIVDHLNSYTAPSTYSVNISGGFYNQCQAYQGTNGLMLRDATIVFKSCMWSTKLVLYDCNTNEVVNSSSTINASYDPGYTYFHNQLNLLIQNNDGTPIVGASVVIVDTNGDMAQAYTGNLATGSVVDLDNVTTDSNGEVGVDILRYIWMREFYPTITTTTTNLNPFTITISASGYQTKTIPITIDKKYEMVVTLEKQVRTIISKGKVAVNTNPADSQSDVFV